MNKKTYPEEEQNQKKGKKRSGKVIKTAVLGTVLGLMASAIVGLSVSLHYSLESVETHESYQRQMDAVYFKAYYDLIDGTNDLGISLKKLGVANSPTMQQSLLYDVWTAASLAESNLGVFEGNDDGLMKAQKFINQLGDYSHALALRVADGEPLTAEEREKLVKLATVAEALQRAMQKLNEQVGEGKMFVGDGHVEVAEAFGEFKEPSFEYPEMIYDGPFSDALETKEPAYLKGEEISDEKGIELIYEYFDGYRIEEVKLSDRGSGRIPTVNYTLLLNGRKAFVQLAKKGGLLVAFNMARAEADRTAIVEADSQYCHTAIEFAKKVGYGDLEVVWSSSAGGECVINLAPVTDKVILYPDLIKVKVEEGTNTVIGFDATHFLFNHRHRRIPAPKLTSAEAQSALSIPAEGEGRLALIPLRGEREILTYEFECERGGTYFVYIDALSGEEVNILYVLDDESGSKTI